MGILKKVVFSFHFKEIYDGEIAEYEYEEYDWDEPYSLFGKRSVETYFEKYINKPNKTFENTLVKFFYFDMIIIINVYQISEQVYPT